MRSLRTRTVPLLAALLLAVGAGREARAQSAAIEESRTHFNAGQRLYEKGEFARAADEFLAAYAKKPFPSLLFNAAACREMLKEYPAAIELLERYLKEDPKAADRAEVEQWIAALKAGASRPAAAGGGEQPAATAPSEAQHAVPRTKGLAVIETYPEGADIHLDEPGGPLLGKTTWSGALPDGRHTLHIELRGYKHEQKEVQPSAQTTEFAYYFFRLSEDPEFGFLVVTSNLPDALIYLDREPGVWGRVSSERNLKKGKHHIAVVREGYRRKELDIDVHAGQLNTVPVQLEVAPIGYVRVRTSESSQHARVQLDGRDVCGEIPCRFEAPEGNHALAIVERGKKGFLRTLRVDKLTEATLQVKLADKPSRLGSIGYFIGAAAVVAGGVTAGLFAAQPTAQLVGSDNDDTRKGFAITYYAVGGALGALFLYLAIHELVRDQGAPSSATVETKDLAWVPSVAPRLAIGATPCGGLDAAWRF